MDQGKKNFLNILSLVMSSEELSFGMPFYQTLVATHKEFMLIYAFIQIVSGGDVIQAYIIFDLEKWLFKIRACLLSVHVVISWMKFKNLFCVMRK